MAAQLDITCLDAAHGENWSAYQADAIDLAMQLPANSIDLSIYSPPFKGLYIYSDSAADLGNCTDSAEFMEQYRYLVREKLRVTRPGRVSCVHSKQLVQYKGRDGMAGLTDFRGEIIRAHVEEGWAYHSEIVIWKDPVIEMQRTKAQGLLYKQLRADSMFSRQGLPEYITIFRKWPKTEEDELLRAPVKHTPRDFPLEHWQKVASPVWMDIRQTNVLKCRKAGDEVREEKDEKHICPLQLDVIERLVELWSNPGDRVWSPFLGIGSEGDQAIRAGRRFIGSELKGSYFAKAVEHLRKAEEETLGSLL